MMHKTFENASELDVRRHMLRCLLALHTSSSSKFGACGWANLTVGLVHLRLSKGHSIGGANCLASRQFHAGPSFGGAVS
jgi:hypothetical protein